MEEVKRMDLHIYGCEKCGRVFESATEQQYCVACEIEMAAIRRARTHNIVHGANIDYSTPERRKEHKKRAEKSARNIGDIVKLAQLAGVSYGEYIAGKRR